MLEKVADDTQDLVAEREKLIEKTERLAAERDVILHEARLVKRRHDGIKAKLEVLAAEGGGSAELVESSRQEMVELKGQFSELRTKRDELAGRIEVLDRQVDALDVRIEARRGEMREEALDSYQDIGKANRNISQSRAELGLLENEMITLFCEIGRYLSIHAKAPSCAAAVKPHRALVAQMLALRTSITLNNRLAGRDVPQATGS
jgi:chromosome segregation ATPase